MTSLYVCYIIQKRYVAHIRNIKQALNHGLKLKKVRKAIAFYQEAWLKLYINMNTELRKEDKNNFENNFGRSIMNVRRHRDIKFVTDDKKRCKLASMPNYHTTK